MKPVVIITESMKTILSRKASLRFASFRQAKIIKAEITWNPGLNVRSKKGFSLCDISPFSETLTPPFIILIDWMELR
jgi:hypothetical protein